MNQLTDRLAEWISINATSTGEFRFSTAVLGLVIAYFGGVLASLTPCVYPMIPITISVVGGLQDGSKPDWKHVLTRAGLYVAGMTLVYSILGVIAGLAGTIFGSFTNTANWYWGLALVFALAGLIMMDVIPFDPLTIWQWIKRKLRFPNKSRPLHTPKSTALGAFVLGATSGLIAAPCTTPVLSAILAVIAKSKSGVVGFSLMVAFSLGLGTLLMLVATFAGVLQVLPRSGHWMNKIKLFSGLILICFSFYLVYQGLQRG